MKPSVASIDAEIERLIANPEHAGHPLRDALAALWNLYVAQAQRLDRIAQLSDRYQSVQRRQNLAQTERFEKRLRQLEKMTRISDRYQDMMRELNGALLHASTHDMLTGLPNRRMLLERAKHDIEELESAGTPLALALLDIDHFKHVNDRFGHDAGDDALQAVATSINETLRADDLCGRWGGEEFLLLLPDATLESARVIVSRVADRVHALEIDGLPADFRLAVSIGLTSYRIGERLDDAISRADAALLEAKRGGRNRVTLA